VNYLFKTLLNLLLPFLFFACFAFISLPLMADDLARKLGNFKTLSADISQVMQTDTGQTTTSTGHIWIKQPGKFRYEIDAPESETFVSDGKDLYDYEPDLMQVVVRPLNQSLSETPLLLLSGGVDQLEKIFVVKESSKANLETQFLLVPREKDALISQLILIFKGENPSAMAITNSFGQTTTVNFSNINKNTTISDSQFKLNLPKDVDVLGG